MFNAFLVNVLPVVIAVIAIAVPTWLGMLQTRVSRHANNIQPLLGLLAEFRSASFHDQHDYVCGRLQQEHAPSGGVRGLPHDAKEAFCNVVYYYQSLATLTVLRIVDEEVFLPLLRYRIVSVWQAARPYVERERELRGRDGSYLSAFEELAGRTAELPHTYLHDRMVDSRSGRWWWTRRRRWGRSRRTA
ncbi:hypothetical protein ACFWDQ_35900 [Streptomyces sp. NPDC060053]|uniref:DUF4760 domain-containing protein n=1 Tax=Streptomyces sp. NPDC060053 TaxID=3347047 RepID=UPI00368AF76E